jgi:hypothetical protein
MNKPITIRFDDIVQTRLDIVLNKNPLLNKSAVLRAALAIGLKILDETGPQAEIK